MAVINSAAPNDSGSMCESGASARARLRRASLHKSNRPVAASRPQLSASAQRRADETAFC